MTLVKFNPVRELIDVEREFNRIFNSWGNRFGVSKKEDNEEYENAVWMPLTDIYEDNVITSYSIHYTKLYDSPDQTGGLIL